MITAVDYARTLLAERVYESTGDNRGPIVDRIERHFGTIGVSWCAMTVCFCFFKATDKNPAFTTESSQAIMRYFRGENLLSHEPQDLKSWKGCIAGWTDANDPAHGHVFFVAGRLTDKDGKLVAIKTIEGNAGPGRGGVVSETRTVPVTGEGHKLWFCNCSDMPGGAWWPDSA